MAMPFPGGGQKLSGVFPGSGQQLGAIGAGITGLQAYGGLTGQ